MKLVQKHVTFCIIVAIVLASLATTAQSDLYVDSTQTDQGAINGTSMTLAYIKSITSPATSDLVYLAHDSNEDITWYKLDTSVDFSDRPYLHFIIDPGARLMGVTGDEQFVVSPQSIVAFTDQYIFDSIIVRWSVPGEVHAGWFGFSHTATGKDNYTALQTMLDTSIDYIRFRILPGGYQVANDTGPIKFKNGSATLFDSENSTITFTHDSNDGFLIDNYTYSDFHFGAIHYQGRGAAVSIVPVDGSSFNDIRWKQIRGYNHRGTGINIDASTWGCSVSYFKGGPIHGFNKGISIYTDGSGPVDTSVFDVNFIYDCNVSLYVHNDNVDGGETINCQTYHINIEASFPGSIAVQTNEIGGLYELTVLGAPGGTILQLDPGAKDNIITMTPGADAFPGAKYIVNNSGNDTNILTAATVDVDSPDDSGSTGCFLSSLF